MSKYNQSLVADLEHLINFFIFIFNEDLSQKQDESFWATRPFN